VQEAEAGRILDGPQQHRAGLHQATQRAAEVAREGEAWAADHHAGAIEREQQERAERIRREGEISEEEGRLRGRSGGR
jgi:hypothetical protein